ncbi:MAG TPA: ABC transporter permease [Acetobacteraceae bacterium]|nr:ABC transporter permease [Acetobacteraceae bacterium]
MSAVPARPPEWQLTRRGAELEVLISGDWVARETGIRSSEDATKVVHAMGEASRLLLSGRGLGRWDSALVVFVAGLRTAAGAAGRSIEVDVHLLPEAAQRLLALASAQPQEAAPQPASEPGLLTRVGERALRGGSEAVAAADLVGQTVLRTGSALLGRSWARGLDVLQLMAEAGAGALVIVAICNGLIGAILAFIGAIQLQQFGAGIYVADLVGIATVREMAAVMTAIVMAGRTGGAYAAHLATMQGNEEIDALQTLGIPVFDYLVLPRVTALVAMMPMLYLYGCAVGLLGGFLVSIAILDITRMAFFEELRSALPGGQFVFGLVKSVAFGALIALAACRIGLHAGRSAADVGRAATDAVVAGIIGVIALDAVFAVCANALQF